MYAKSALSKKKLLGANKIKQFKLVINVLIPEKKEKKIENISNILFWNNLKIN